MDRVCLTGTCIVGEYKKLVLRKEAWSQLPSLLQDFATQFRAQQIFFYDPPQELPPASPKGIHYRSDGHEYLAYVKRQLCKGTKDKGILKSFIVGLGGCGAEGKQLIAEIKTKHLR